MIGKAPTAVAVGGGAIGGTLGGALTARVSWRWVFFVNVPLGAALVALAWSRLPRHKASLPDRGLDITEAVTVTGGLTALVWALQQPRSTAAAGSGRWP